MNKLFKVLSILTLIFISVFTNLFDYDKDIIKILTIIFTCIFCFFTGRTSYNDKKIRNKYILIYLIWNMSYLTFTNSLKDINNIINTLLLKEVYLDILPTLAISYIILSITKNNKIYKYISVILLGILFIIFNNYIFLYSLVFIIGNITTFKLKNINNRLLNLIDYTNIGIYILHKILLYLLINLNIISFNSISDLIGSVVFIYVIGFIISYYLKMWPLIRNII